jgi:hypothetical protein
MSVEAKARRDAREYARAQMYYGEGAGTRRKLIEATVASKIQKDPRYASAFRAEYQQQDLGEHAAKAHRERVRTDTSEALARNVKGVATGNLQSVSPSIIVLLILGTVAHKTGLDKKAWGELQVQRARFQLWRRDRKRDRVVKLVKEA